MLAASNYPLVTVQNIPCVCTFRLNGIQINRTSIVVDKNIRLNITDFQYAHISCSFFFECSGITAKGVNFSFELL